MNQASSLTSWQNQRTRERNWVLFGVPGHSILSWGVFLSPWWCAAFFFLEQLTHVFLGTAGEDGYLGELSTQLENLNIQRVLSFPWSCFPHSLLFFYQKSTEMDDASKWCPPGLLARVLCPFVLCFLSLKEAHKLCQLFITSVTSVWPSKEETLLIWPAINSLSRA